MVLISPECLQTEGFLGFISIFDIMTYLAFWSYFKDEKNWSKRTSFSNMDWRVSDVLEVRTLNDAVLT